MNETLFYAFGLGLVVLAIVVSFVGLRWENFPGSRGVMIAVVGIFALLVVGTSVFGWRNAEDEQEQRATELAEVVEEAESTDDAEAQESSEDAGSNEPSTAASADGALVFETQGCGSCHRLDAAGSTGETGPSLDGALAGESPEYIETSIIDPADEVAEGYPPGVMPPNYETELSPEELRALVEYLVESTS